MSHWTRVSALFLLVRSIRSSTVQQLSLTSLKHIRASPHPAFVKLQVGEDASCPECGAFGQVWGELEASHPGIAWEARCAEQPFMCTYFHIDSDNPNQDKVFVEIWNGTAFYRYSGKKEMEALIKHIRKVIRRNSKFQSKRLVKKRAKKKMRVRQIPRLFGISVSDFRSQHIKTATPAILDGAAAHWPAAHWDTQHLLKSCGDRPMKLKSVCVSPDDEEISLSVPMDNSRSYMQWAGQSKLSPDKMNISTVADFLNAQRRGEGVYMFDESFEKFCPQLVKETFASKYFLVDYQQQALPESLRSWTYGHHCPPAFEGVARFSQPSIFIGHDGVHSALHADSKGNSFWMVVLNGRKWFRLFNASDAKSCLYPTAAGNSYPGAFEVDAFDPNLKRHPLLASCVAWEGIVGKGDIIFIPAKWPHAVRNLDDTIAMSYNFVDETSMASWLTEWAHEFKDADTQLINERKLRLASAAAFKNMKVGLEFPTGHCVPWAAKGYCGSADVWRQCPKACQAKTSCPSADIGECGIIPIPKQSAVVTIATVKLGFAPFFDATNLTAVDAEDMSWDNFFRSNRLEHQSWWNGKQYVQQLTKLMADEEQMRITIADALS